MSACRRCGASIGWAKLGGANVPMEQDGKTKHECPGPCRECAAPVLWVDRDGRRVRVDADTKKDHVCARVSDWLSKPTGHHGSASRFKLYAVCQSRFYQRSVLGIPDRDESGPEAQTGKLLHAAGLEVVGQARWREQRLTDPVTEDELRGALESPAVLAKESWTPDALHAAHELVPRTAARLDFSFLIGDEHGAYLERKFVVPVGGGVEVGGIVDMVERLPGDGKRRDPLEPARPDDVLVIPDLKTGRNVEATAADGFYGTWARLMWPENAVVIVRNYVALDIKPVQISGERLDRAVRESHQLARAIVVKARTAADDPDAWPASPGAHCSSCAFQGSCSAFQTAHARALAPDLPVGKKAREAAIPTTREGLLAAIEVAEERDAFARPVSEWLRTLRSAAKKAFADQVRADGTAEVGAFGVEIKTTTREAYDVEDGVQTRIKVWRLDEHRTEQALSGEASHHQRFDGFPSHGPGADQSALVGDSPRGLGVDPEKDRAETTMTIGAAGRAAGKSYEDAVLAKLAESASLYCGLTPDMIEALANVERIPETLGVVALAIALDPAHEEAEAFSVTSSSGAGATNETPAPAPIPEASLPGDHSPIIPPLPAATSSDPIREALPTLAPAPTDEYGGPAW